MRLYHYHNQSLDELKTKRAQGSLKPEEIEEAERDAMELQLPGAYIDRISFFFDPIPSREIGDMFGTFHQCWFNGNTLVEHVIDTADLDAQVNYQVVETPDKLRHLDASERDDENPAWVAHYFHELRLIQEQNGERGISRDALEAKINRFSGKTLDFYLAARKRQDWERNKTKYTAAVPHVMLYPTSGIIPVRERYRVTIGKSDRIPL